MDNVLYGAMRGGNASFRKQELIANNLANINTTGFRADLHSAQTMYMNQAGTNQTLAGQSFVVDGQAQSDFSPGEIKTTGRDLDIAIEGDGWIAVKDNKNREVYTRAGDLKMDVNGRLMTSSGKLVLGDGGPISIPPAQKIDIASDGTITIVPLDAKSNELAILERIKLVSINSKDLFKNEEGMMQLKDGGRVKKDANVTLVKGALEGSNVNAVEQMVKMITAGREFESHMKMMQSVDDGSRKLAQLLQL